jgi:transcriptional regulator with XRE-family HTH domain
MSIRAVFGAACRDARVGLDLSQQDLAGVLGIHRGHLANIEAGRTNVSIDLVDRIAATLGQRLELIVHPPRFVGARPLHDTVHAWCSGYAGRRLSAAGWLIAREVDVTAGAARGWIDLVAYDPARETLVIVEIKTRLDDLGAIERQVGWYEGQAMATAHRLGWRPRRIHVWLLVLASDEVDRSLTINRDLVDQAFPGRAMDMLATLTGSAPTANRSIALIDPASRRTRWLIPPRSDGRRSAAPYRDYADAARRLPRRRN